MTGGGFCDGPCELGYGLSHIKTCTGECERSVASRRVAFRQEFDVEMSIGGLLAVNVARLAARGMSKHTQAHTN